MFVKDVVVPRLQTSQLTSTTPELGQISSALFIQMNEIPGLQRDRPVDSRDEITPLDCVCVGFFGESIA